MDKKFICPACKTDKIKAQCRCIRDDVICINGHRSALCIICKKRIIINNPNINVHNYCYNICICNFKDF